MTTLWRVANRTGRIQILHVVELSGCKVVNGWAKSGLRIGQSMRRLLLGFKCSEGDCAKTVALEMQRSRWIHRYLREQIHKAGLEEKGYRWEGEGEIVVLFCTLFMFHRDSHLFIIDLACGSRRFTHWNWDRQQNAIWVWLLGRSGYQLLELKIWWSFIITLE